MSEVAATTGCDVGQVSKKKAANSYYYWHGHEKERAKVGDVAPMPSPVLVKREEPCTTPSSTLIYPITKYTWADGEKVVTVYIDTNIDAKEEFVEDSLNVFFSRRRCQVSFTGRVSTGGRRCRQLQLALSKSIDSDACSFKVKPASKQIVVRLVKRSDGTWHDLTTDTINTTESDDDEKSIASSNGNSNDHADEVNHDATLGAM